jgi:hypothetical protein
MEPIVWRDPPPQKSGKPPGTKNYRRKTIDDLLPMLEANPGVEALAFEDVPNMVLYQIREWFPQLTMRHVPISDRIHKGYVDIYLSYPKEA